MTTEIDAVSRLRDALEAGPTEGPWEVLDGTRVGVTLPSLVDDCGHDSHCVALAHGNPRLDPQKNAAYIAACDPATIRTLLEEVAEARQIKANADALNDRCVADAIEIGELRSHSEAITSALAACRNLIPEDAYFSLPHADNAMGDPESVPDVLRSYIDTLRARMAELEAQSVAPKPTP